MNRRLYGGDMIGRLRGRNACGARQTWHTVFATHGRWAVSEHEAARIAQRHAWATVVGARIEARNIVHVEPRPVGEVHHLPVAR